MTAVARRRVPPPPKTLRPVRVFVIYDRDPVTGAYMDVVLGEVESTDTTSAEMAYARREGLSAKQRRSIVARAKPVPETVAEEEARERRQEALADELDAAADAAEWDER